MAELTYTVDRISCGSCRALVTEELEELPGVESVEVDIGTKRVVVTGEADDTAVRALLEEIGYGARPA